MYQALFKSIPSAILIPAATLPYKDLQYVITEDDLWEMFEHVLRKWAPHISGKVEDLQKQIYYLWFISS